MFPIRFWFHHAKPAATLKTNEKQPKRVQPAERKAAERAISLLIVIRNNKEKVGGRVQSSLEQFPYYT